MIEANKLLVKRFIEDVFNGGRTKLLPELVAPEHVSHLPSGDHYGPEGVRIDIAGFRSAFPDLELTVEELLADEDRVAWRFTANGTHEGHFMGVPATGRQVRVEGLAIDHVQDGKTVERWVHFDALGLLQQLGAFPNPNGHRGD